ncbi:unnamed protein product [Symbiodinium sp. CCMP2592]|nr:unnamed protein product [Symbiodinium sp. CCMP2592]
MPIPRWESVIANLVQLQAPKVLLLLWTTNVDLTMQVQLLELFSGEVYKAHFWQQCFGSPTPKPTCVWSNSTILVEGLDAAGHICRDDMKSATEFRVYTKEFGKKLLELWEQEKASMTPRLSMRQKAAIPPGATDKELFVAMELGDTWAESEMIEVWAYLLANKNLCVPESWQSTVDAFDAELKETAPSLKWFQITTLHARTFQVDLCSLQVLAGDPLREDLLAAHEGN